MMPNKPPDFFYRKLLNNKQVDIETERQLLASAADGCADSQEKLILANMRGIAAICDYYTTDVVKKEELYGVCICTFIELIPQFNPSRYDVRFITFARKYIHGAIVKSDESNRSIIMLPPHLRQKIYLIKRTMSKMNTTEYTREEAIEYIANEINETIVCIRNVFEKYIDVEGFVFLDNQLQQNTKHKSEIMESIPEEIRDPYRQIDARIDLENILECLNDREKEVVLRRWNIMPYETIEEISKRWRVTRQAVSLKYVRAMKKIRAHIKNDLLDSE